MKKIGRLLPEALGRDEVLRAARAAALMRRWSEVVGTELASRSQPDRYERGILWVAVSGSAWAQELRMIKPHILNKLDEIGGEKSLITDVRFGVRPFFSTSQNPPSRPSHALVEFAETAEESIREIADRRIRNWPDTNGA
jgi:predicted nucleic acid-binding Zn ribbon protein